MDKTTEPLSGSKWFSSLDMVSGYWQKDHLFLDTLPPGSWALLLLIFHWGVDRSLDDSIKSLGIASELVWDLRLFFYNIFRNETINLVLMSDEKRATIETVKEIFQKLSFKKMTVDYEVNNRQSVGICYFVKRTQSELNGDYCFV
ncbi:hypothetical protein RF11_11282 [Thelohanellus kitauei]|uniref:Uncharacterized protein n=1 Tax=Thelohanellus kitauei TaxID=669202 RepID=A0A0C2IWF2_THEKT|nr:hypothetical protein RF11_11282 [Thelohanellus kitauei]